MICDLWPDSVRELVDYLKREPLVLFPDIAGKPIRKFEGFVDGALSFGAGWRFTLRTSAMLAEPGVEFNVGMFRWMHGGTEIRMVYLRSGEPQ